MRQPAALACLAFLGAAMTGCPADRHASPVLRGAAVDVPPPMPHRAPSALAVITRLRGPESALHDASQDVYFISNLNGGLQTVDDNGFITRVNAKTMAVELKWIDGGAPDVRLDAPKGMAVAGETLYVSDITAVRKFDRRTGRPRGEIALPGATLINDLTTDGTSVFVSDTGLRVGPGTTFYATGTDAIWKITGDRAVKIAAGPELRHPNGLDLIDGALHAVTFGGDELYTLSDGKPERVASVPRGQLDGVVHLADGSVVISSWLGEGIYRGRRGRKLEPILTGIDSPADIGYDAKRGRLLVPSSGTNQVTIHALR
jgi:hypothetical protein